MLRETSRHNREGSGDPCLNLQTIVDCLQPQAVLLYDIDRVEFEAEMLGMLEQMRLRVPLIIATANGYESLNSAVLRPGRFDEVVRVFTPCRELVEQMVSTTDPHLDALAKSPIAWVAEYVARRDTLGPDHAKEEFEELRDRLNEFNVHEKIDNLTLRAEGVKSHRVPYRRPFVRSFVRPFVRSSVRSFGGVHRFSKAERPVYCAVLPFDGGWS